jgi:AcrR family transcriptional regulator
MVQTCDTYPTMSDDKATPMRNEAEFTRAPKQTRSREALERVIETATSLLDEVGLEGFAIHEISRRSNVSIGSIYARFASREDLLRVVQVRVLEEIHKEQIEITDESHWNGLTLQATLRGFIHEYALSLERHAVALRSFMSLASSDPVIAKMGKSAYGELEARVHQLLLNHRKEIRHPDPQFAVELCFRIAYSALARHLGLGTESDAAHEGDWNEMIEAVGDMCVAYLLSDLAISAPRLQTKKVKLKSTIQTGARNKAKVKGRKN